MADVSLPSRGRGLKSVCVVLKSARPSVAPFTGAWIEIRCSLCISNSGASRSLHGGVDWNKLDQEKTNCNNQSLPSRGRGLKLWTKTVWTYTDKSLPSRGRGLKLERLRDELNKKMSLPSRGRGLKYDSISSNKFSCQVAPFTGAWIEINYMLRNFYLRFCRSLHGGVDWNKELKSDWSVIVTSLPSRGRGLKLDQANEYDLPAESLPSRGRGLKFGGLKSAWQGVTSLPSRGRGLKLRLISSWPIII